MTATPGLGSAGSDPVLIARDGAVATITLNRPDALNGLDLALKESLRDAVEQVSTDPSVRSVVLTGAGRAFCVGQDLKEHLNELRRDRPAPLSDTVHQHYNPIVLALATMPKPVVAAVNGIAAGAGASLAFAADFRVLGSSAGFNTAFAGIGLSCDTGTSWTLPRLIGHARAVDLLYFPRTLGAFEALSLGLATDVIDDEQLQPAAHELAVRLAAGPTLAFGAIRQSLAFSAGHPMDAALAYEADQMTLTGLTDDHRSAVDAFIAKQGPVFRGC